MKTGSQLALGEGGKYLEGKVNRTEVDDSKLHLLVGETKFCQQYN